MNATIVAFPLALAKSLKAEPVVSGCRFAAPYFPMTHLNAHVSGDRVAAAYQRSVLRSQERLGETPSGSVKPELSRAGLGLSLPVVERATPGTEEANAAEASRACRIGDTRADFSRIGILDDLDPMHRRNA